ncbi:unnamed protein product [Paramecium sonneborni]|uniref:Uncharacterized protein n=1 Tax=Paramecium sonneborni TaxID=65129 RepID=A0A8S1R3Y6_9CILI|nr:unnamed protein product [Paramecium sonneborni]
MIQSNNYCLIHPNFLVGGIYKSQHSLKIQRKICLECILKFKIPPEQVLAKQDFIQSLLQKSQQLNMVSEISKSESQYILKKFLSKLDDIKKEITLIFENIKESIQTIQEYEKMMDNQYLKIVNQDLNPFECSDTYLDFLVNFLEGNIFEQEISKKKKLVSQIRKIEAVLEKLVSNMYNTNHLIEKIGEDFFQISNKETIFHLEGIENGNKQLKKIQFDVTISQNGNKVYKKDGQIIREEKQKLGAKKEEFIYNLEQMKYLEFEGQYGVKGYKIKTWKYLWKGKHIGGGNYNIMGQKEGKWIEFNTNNKISENKVLEIGCYSQGKKTGLWFLSWNNLQIGGGSYNQERENKKIGNWIELDELFNYDKQVTYSGEYNIEGMKVGRWDITYCKFNEKEFQQIGGGSYDQEGNQKKIGKWIELDKMFNYDKQVTYSGEYNKQQMKVGRWDISYYKYKEKEFHQIGGGLYDQEGEKIGKWVELDERFCNPKQVTYGGEYKKGIKVGKWEICFKGFESNSEYQQIGGGSYDEEGEKIGKWVELDESFCNPKQVTYSGEYKKVIKEGRWDIWFKGTNRNSEYQQIGGGSYDQEGEKIGEWIELDEKFCNPKQITYVGEYKKGIKVGRWNICFKGTDQNSEYQQIGGGQYNQEQEKIGEWIELSQMFCYQKQIIFNGEYKKNKKIGRWNIMYCKEGDKEYQSIGGGSYDQEGDQKKIGQWDELDEMFDVFKIVIYSGQYNVNSIKIGKWIKRIREYYEVEFYNHDEKIYDN